MRNVHTYTYSSFIQQFEQAKGQATELILSLDDYTFLSRPAPDTWCVAECFSHLYNFGTIYLGTIQQGFEAHTPSGAEPEMAFPPRFYWKWIARWFEPPYRIKVKTFPSFEPEPVAGYTRHQLLKEFTDLQNQFITQLEKARDERYDLGEIRVKNPVFTFVKMKLSECYTVATVHQRRHFWQAKQILKTLRSE